MKFNKHSELVDLHALLGPSKYHWVNYSDEKLVNMFRTSQAARKGAELHEFAQRAITLGIRLPQTQKTLNRYVNDAIGFRMVPEQPLFYSYNCFGTADAISFKREYLRIHDLKSGVSPSSMRQLEIYAALFCLEYGVKPGTIKIELRIYQNDEVEVSFPDVDDILHVMDRIITFDKAIERLKAEE